MSDLNNRKSITGYLIFFCNVLIAWKSKLQKSVMLSSTEGEYVSLSELSTEILFLIEVITFMGIEITFPIIVKVDNAGSIFLANNKALGQRTKHIETRYHFVREYVEDGTLKIIFVKSEDNSSDIMTKNTSGKIFWKHTMKFMDYSKVDM